MLHLTLRQLEYVVTVARAGSLSGAATTLNVSQPSLSVALGQVEDTLGAAVLAQKLKSVVCADAGGVAKLADVIADADAAVQRKALHSFKGGAMMLGLTGLTRWSEQAEQILRSREPAPLDPVWATSLRHMARRTCAELEPVFGEFD